ncbi:MAG: hypothetical protein QM681_18285 [Novosphingobium sp.]
MSGDLIARLRDASAKWEEAHLNLASALFGEAADALETLMTQVMALEDRAERSEHRYRHTRQWHAERWERITAYAKEHGFWDDIACIMANGTLNFREGRAYDPPTYAQQLNAAIHRAEAAEDRASKLREHGETMAFAIEHEGYRSTRLKQAVTAYRATFPEPTP